MKKHIVRLLDEVRQILDKMVQSGTRPAQVVRRCQVLLKSDEGCTDGEIAEHVGCSVRTLRKQFCAGGVEQAIYDSPRSGRPEFFTGRRRQQVIALACTDPPEGRQRWTLELLCKHAVKQRLVETVGNTVDAGPAACSWRSSRRPASDWYGPSGIANVPTLLGSYAIS